MSIQWELEDVDGVGVLRVSGFLGEQAVHRFEGAVDWVRARCAGPVVLDLTALRGWNGAGEAALVNAAALVGSDRGALAVCGLGERCTPALLACYGLGVIRLFPDLETALAALAAG
ncbi:STAS domain-containing protein [Streptomyces sp. FH025]|uniref:STAS domain-containing protein n=1 Tax=Streptomyces sp. FH025 TaxID=2815937 RepID=UPI001A9ED353|nr:STAS domain-containing protein [Streptomyces sp. FH025]MBO1417478.1 hypothetical protein [Streptomyces sp. FH025]